jgi:hypothetical protein
MKNYMLKEGWIDVFVCLVLLLGMSGSAYGSGVVVRDVEADLGIMLAPASSACHPCESLDAVVLQPEKLAVLGLRGVGKGDTLRVVHQVSNLWRIVDTQNGARIRIRLRVNADADGKWPFPTAL